MNNEGRQCYVYQHTRLDKNEVFYIGIAKQSKQYPGKHYRAYEKSKRSVFWKRITSKTDYKVEIILDNLTWKEACEKEKEFIKLYGRRNLKTGTLCNLTDGGEGAVGFIASKELLEKRSKARILSGYKPSLETREKIRKANLGKKCSEETKEKIKLSLSLLPKRVCSLQQKEAISKKNSGKNNGGARLILDVATGIYFETMEEAAISYCMGYSQLYHQLHGRAKNKTNLVFV